MEGVTPRQLGLRAPKWRQRRGAACTRGSAGAASSTGARTLATTRNGAAASNGAGSGARAGSGAAGEPIVARATTRYGHKASANRGTQPGRNSGYA